MRWQKTKSSFILFAYDTNTFYQGKDQNKLQNIIYTDLLHYHDWFCANKLSLNVTKTNYIVFGHLSKHWNQTIKFNNTIIERVHETKFLGVFIDSNLSWSNHIDSICSKISKSIAVLSRLKHILPRKILRSIYQTLILPHLTYCCSIWSSASKTALSKLTVLQKRAIRHICFANYQDSSSKLFSSLQLLKLPDLIHINLVSIIYQAEANTLPNSLSTIFTTNNKMHSHNTRHSSHIHCPPCRTNLIRQNTFNRAIDSWNLWPTSVKDCHSLPAFRKTIQHNCLQTY